jgi:type IV secretion system protein VirB10
MNLQDKPQIAEDEDQFELSPEQATGMDSGAQPGLFNRKRVLIALCISFAVIVCGGLLLNALKPSKKGSGSAETSYSAANAPAEFLASLRDKAVVENARARQREQAEAPAQAPEPEPLLPPVAVNRPREVETIRASPPPPAPQPPSNQRQAQPPQPSQPQQAAQDAAHRSSLVPNVQGSLFPQNARAQAAPAAQAGSPASDYFNNPPASRASAANAYGNQPSAYAAQNNQEDKQAFYDSSNGGTVFNGQYIGDNALWTGTVIPGVLETAINTDLPGNVLARVTQNVYDSRTGRSLLIPQGTLLVARYNSSVSYAQSRVQIVWDTLIRPDGWQIDLEGANSVDRSGMSGQAAQSDEHWFEYLKAAGIVALFSIANSRMTETAANAASGETAANIAQANSAVVNQLSGSLTGRAMDIQPTLTVEQGTVINIMLNKTLYLPPVSGYPVNRKYILE